MTDLPLLHQFRIEPGHGGAIHLVFDMPGRSMNVFSNAAIHELGRFANWLKASDVSGVVVRSGKPSAFCAGADLNELGVAYDMIMQAPRDERTRVAFDHFFPLSRALRALETSGKPVAAAIQGLALGGGCELALGCHYRVLADSPRTLLGLPESLVGLLPGAGGTQRLPRLVGIEAALPVLLEGKRLGTGEALSLGAADEIVQPGEEVAAAERWVLSAAGAAQPWDRAGWPLEAPAAVAARLAPARVRVAAETRGHYPAPVAILDCIEQGYPLPMDKAIEAEMAIFAGLIQRPEPRNMIQTLFLGKLDFEKRAKAGTLPVEIDAVAAAFLGAIRFEVEMARKRGIAGDVVETAIDIAGLGRAGGKLEQSPPLPPGIGRNHPGSESAGLWFEQAGDDVTSLAARLLVQAAASAASQMEHLAPADQRLIDYAIVSDLGFPSYLGGPGALVRYLGSEAVQRIAA